MQNKRYANIQNGRPTLYVVQRITFYRSSGRATPLSGTCYSPERHPITANAIALGKRSLEARASRNFTGTAPRAVDATSRAVDAGKGANGLSYTTPEQHGCMTMGNVRRVCQGTTGVESLASNDE